MDGWLPSLLATLVGVLAGGLITWKVAERYYISASVQLTKEAADLRRMIREVLDALKRAGFEFERREGTIHMTLPEFNKSRDKS